MQRFASEGVRSVRLEGGLILVGADVDRTFRLGQRMGKRRGYAGVEPAPRRTVHKDFSLRVATPAATRIPAARTPCFAQGAMPCVRGCPPGPGGERPAARAGDYYQLCWSGLPSS
jgi:hypothetical protein